MHLYQNLIDEIDKNHDYIIEQLNEFQIPNLINSIQKCFPAPAGETMANHLGIFPIDYFRYSEMVAQKAYDDRLTLVASHATTHEIAGFMISEPLSDMVQYSSKKIPDIMKPLIGILEELDHEYLNSRSNDLGDTIHFYMLGVDPNIRYSGLGYRLAKAAIEAAESHGYKRCIAEATGVGSQAMLSKLGFQTFYEIAYNKFMWEGKYPFAQMKNGPSHCKLMELVTDVPDLD